MLAYIQENLGRHLHEVRKTMHNVNGEFSNETDILKKNQTGALEVKNSVSQMKNTQLHLSDGLIKHRKHV